MKHICDAERASIIEKFDELHGTLNGWPAVICGRKLDYPKVCALNPPDYTKAEYSWQTLRRAVDNGKVDLRSY
jgi:hypothetical protein